MFKVGQTIIYNDCRVYVISDKIEKPFNDEMKEYFVLKDHPLYEINSGLTIFASVDNFINKARCLITKEQANNLLHELEKMKTVWNNDYKIRKNVFMEHLKSNDIFKNAVILKTLYIKDLELRSQNKGLTISDRRFFDNLKKNILIELSLVLKESIDEVENKIIISINKNL